MQLIDLLKDAAKVTIVIDETGTYTVTGHEMPTGTAFDVVFLSRGLTESAIYVNLYQEIAIDNEGRFGLIRQQPTINGMVSKECFAIAYKFVRYTA